MKADPPLKPTLSCTTGPDYYGAEFQCGFYTKVFYWGSTRAFNSAAKWWRGIIFQYIKLLLAQWSIHPTGNQLKLSPPCKTCLSPRLQRLITLLTFTHERDISACRIMQKRCSGGAGVQSQLNEIIALVQHSYTEINWLMICESTDYCNVIDASYLHDSSSKTNNNYNVLRWQKAPICHQTAALGVISQGLLVC